jgi:heme/copper-type cytochrome/quinol oxidase subunit 2
VRLGGIDTTGDQDLLDPPHRLKNNKDVIYNVVAAVVALVVISVLICIVWHRRNHRRARNEKNININRDFPPAR